MQDGPRARCRESREFRESSGAEFRARGRLAEFELLFIDFQCLDAVLEGRWWNSKLHRCSGESGNPTSSLSERRLDNLPLVSRLSVQSRKRFGPRYLRRSPFGKPPLIN